LTKQEFYRGRSSVLGKLAGINPSDEEKKRLNELKKQKVSYSVLHSAKLCRMTSFFLLKQLANFGELFWLYIEDGLKLLVFLPLNFLK